MWFSYDGNNQIVIELILVETAVVELKETPQSTMFTNSAIITITIIIVF